MIGTETVRQAEEVQTKLEMSVNVSLYSFITGFAQVIFLLTETLPEQNV